MNLYSRDEIAGFNTKIAELNKEIQDLDKDIKQLQTDINAEDSEDNIADMKKIMMNKSLSKDEKTLEVKNLKSKISATA